MASDTSNETLDVLLGTLALTGAGNWSQLYLPPNETGPAPQNFGPPMLSPNLVRLQEVVRALQMYYSPTVAILGLLANLTCLLTLSHSALRKVSANQYLVGILLAETIYLLTLIHSWLNEHSIHFYSIGGWCQFVTFARRVSVFLAMWYTVGLSVDGLIRVCFSDLEFRMCTVWRCRIFMIGAAILAIIVYLNTSITVAVEHFGNIAVCFPLQEFAKSLVVLDRIDVFINCLVPYLTVVVMVVLMCVRVIVNYRRDRCLMQSPSSPRVTRIVYPSGSRTPAAPYNRAMDIVDEDNPPSYFIIAFIWIFLLLNLPSRAMYVYTTFKNIAVPLPRQTLQEYLTGELLAQFIKTKSVVCFVAILTLHKAFRKVAWHRLRKIASWLKCTCCHRSPARDSESYPLRAQDTQKTSASAVLESHKSTSFLCEIEVREQGST